MRVSDIPAAAGYYHQTFPLEALLKRARAPKRASWEDLPRPTKPGVYILYWPRDEQIRFRQNAGEATHAEVVARDMLEARWNLIQSKISTDIIYVGKGSHLRKRVSALVRFGVGRSKTHVGGEWAWQITEIRFAEILVQCCPLGKQRGFENWILTEFFEQHGDWPLANRRGPVGCDIWRPRG